MAFHLWSSEWQGKQVTIHTDNQACYWLVTKGCSRDNLRLCMSRWLAMQQIAKDFRTTSAWIPTSENTLADALSGYGDGEHRDKFNTYCKSLAETPIQCHVRDEHFDLSD